MFPPGRVALLQDPTVAEALQQVVAEGWTEQARSNAESALLALSDYQPETCNEQHEHQQNHVMLSYQWDAQEVVRRIVNELQVRGYRTWFGAHQAAFSLVPKLRVILVTGLEPCNVAAFQTWRT